MQVVRVAVNYPQKNTGLLYHVEAPPLLEVGQVVEVPLGKRTALGCVVASSEEHTEEYKSTPREKIKAVKEIYPDWKVSEEELKLYEWMSQYYHYSLGQLIFDCSPNYLKRPRPLVPRLGDNKEISITPNAEQAQVINSVLENSTGFRRFLIHGVTGSGKTLIYLKLIQHYIREKKSVLFLIPEINLTPQLIDTFAEFLDCEIYAYHSELSDSEKFLMWKRAAETGKPALFLGVRSSVFLPVKELGLIIIDEEHDTSFKQEDRCPYNARDVASKKAQLLQVPIVMGSATPSVENYAQFHKPENRKNLFELTNRAGNAFLPKIELIDARSEKGDESGEIWPLVPKAKEAIAASLAKGEQALVFVNRLGFANYLQCRSCGHQFHCPNCAITLRYYKKKGQLACHHCEYKIPMPEQCPHCGCLTLMQKGFGTEKVQEVLQEIFPDKVIGRFDREDIKNFKQLEERLADFHDGKIDILVGTQMLSKGHNFERVKLVLILGIDGQLNFPDFRSQERVYQTVTQVAGRSGRYSQDGKVVIQTFNPESPLFLTIQQHEFHQFYKDELEVRQLCDCPPFKRLVMVHFTSRFQDRLVEHMSKVVGPVMQQLIVKNFKQVHLLGPRPAFIEKKSGQFTWSLLLKTEDLAQLHNLLKTFENNYHSPSGISYKIDVDPYTLM